MQSGRNHQYSAFTLIELILVMAVLVIAVSVVAPVMSGFFRGRMLDLEARRFLALVHAGQSRAVSEGLPVCLWVDAARNEYGLTQESTAREGDSRAMDFRLDETLRLEVVNPVAIAVNGRNLPAIRVMPDGSFDESSPVVLRLTGADGAVLRLVQSSDHSNYEISKTSE